MMGYTRKCPRAYESWSGMKQRCFNPKKERYPLYGGRGITVCERWLKFDNFFEDMGPCPVGHSLDRIDSDGNYEPNNCRWATKEVQRNNRRDSLLLTARGKTMSVAQWAREVGISYWTIYTRLECGWNHEDAIFLKEAPPRPRLENGQYTSRNQKDQP